MMPFVTTTRTKVSVHQSVIEQDFWRGQIYDNVKDTAELHLEIAQRHAPNRTGLLSRTMDKVMTPAGHLEWRYTIRVNVPYAEYTLRPTGPLIWPRKGHMFMIVRPRPYSYYTSYTPRMQVQGYYSDNWLEETITPTFIAENLL